MAKKINIKGPIVDNNELWVYEYLDMEATAPSKIDEAIAKADGKELEVIINSGGGSVFAGSEIYTALKDYTEKVTVKIVGVAASAASIIAMAGDRVLISPTAEMMIHNITMWAGGDYREMQHTAEVLKDYNSTIANAYQLKSGMDKKELLKLMDEETWLTPEKAVELKLVDEIMFTEDTRLVASMGLGGLLPPEVINKIRSTVKSPQQKQADFLLSKFKFLKLKGEMQDG